VTQDIRVVALSQVPAEFQSVLLCAVLEPFTATYAYVDSKVPQARTSVFASRLCRGRFPTDISSEGLNQPPGHPPIINTHTRTRVSSPTGVGSCHNGMSSLCYFFALRALEAAGKDGGCDGTPCHIASLEKLQQQFCTTDNITVALYRHPSLVGSLSHSPPFAITHLPPRHATPSIHSKQRGRA